MSDKQATVLSLDAVKLFRKSCEDFVVTLRKGRIKLVEATAWVHQGYDGWDDSDYEQIKKRVEGIVTGIMMIDKKIKDNMIPYVDAKIHALSKKPQC